MAGMLPGVESARRRRCWGSSTGWWSEPPPPSSGHNYGSSSRRSSLCLYTSNHNSLLSSTSNSNHQQRSMVNNQDEKLGVVAREAKERLDERLRAQYRKSEPKRRNSQERVRVVDQDQDQDQVNSAPASAAGGGLKKSASKRMMSWAKLSSWKSSEQDECAVCLEPFRDSENLAHLPCAHRFHSRCLVPWLENNAHCPCCRTPI